jgi:peptidoglycan/LPS O-acetylase OafA/YrhL
VSTDRLLDRLARKTSTGRYIPEIDGLRFFCILLVVLLHLEVYLTVLHVGGGFDVQPRVPPNDWLGATVGEGALGLMLFFMISGFVLALPFAAQGLGEGPSVSLRRYYLRRLTRLEPPYLVSLTLFLFLVPAVMTGPSLERLLPHYLAGCLYLHGLIYGAHNPVNVPSWSLEIEVQFYLLVPLLGLAFSIRDRARRRIRLAALGLAALIAQDLLHYAVGLNPYNLLPYLVDFMVGFVVADVYVSEWKGAPKTARRWDAASLAAWPALFILFASPAPATASLGVPVAGFVVLCAAFRGPVARRVLRNRWITTIGGMCYSIYLVHYPVVFAVGRLSRGILKGPYDAQLVELLAMVIPVLLVVSTAFYLLVERPCMERDWPSRLRGRIGGLLGSRSITLPEAAASGTT